MRSTSAILLSLAVACLAAHAHASQCAVPVRGHPVIVRHEVVRQDTVIQVFTFVPVLLPPPPAAAYPLGSPGVAPPPAGAAGGPPPDDGPPVAVPWTAAPVPLDHVAVFRARCSSCHTAPGKGGVALFSPDGRFAPTAPARQVLVAVETQGPAGLPVSPRMPPSARYNSSAGLSAAELDSIRRWARSQ